MLMLEMAGVIAMEWRIGKWSPGARREPWNSGGSRFLYGTDLNLLGFLPK